MADGIECAHELQEQQREAFLVNDGDALDLAGAGLDKVVTDQVAAALQREEFRVPGVDEQFQAIAERFNEEGGN